MLRFVTTSSSENEYGKWHFWSEIGSEFGEPGGTPPLIIPRSAPSQALLKFPLPVTPPGRTLLTLWYCRPLSLFQFDFMQWQMWTGNVRSWHGRRMALGCWWAGFDIFIWKSKDWETKETENHTRLTNLNLDIILTCNNAVKLITVSFKCVKWPDFFLMSLFLSRALTWLSFKRMIVALHLISNFSLSIAETETRTPQDQEQSVGLPLGKTL